MCAWILARLCWIFFPLSREWRKWLEWREPPQGAESISGLPISAALTQSVIAQHWRNWTRKGSSGSAIDCFCGWDWKQAALHQTYQDCHLSCTYSHCQSAIISTSTLQSMNCNCKVFRIKCGRSLATKNANCSLEPFGSHVWRRILDLLDPGRLGAFDLTSAFQPSLRHCQSCFSGWSKRCQMVSTVMVMQWRFEDVSDQRGTGYQLGLSGVLYRTICSWIQQGENGWRRRGNCPTRSGRSLAAVRHASNASLTRQLRSIFENENHVNVFAVDTCWNWTSWSCRDVNPDASMC